MNNLIIKPQGIDFEVQHGQKIIYDKLTSLWGIIIEGYGMVSKNERNGKIIPEWKKDKNDYTGTLLTKENRFFFIKESDSVRDDFGNYKANVGLYFIVNLEQAKPLIKHRATQEVQQDVMSFVDNCGFNYIKGITDTNLDDVLREFRNLYNESKTYDMQPWHIFKVNIVIRYDLKQKCNE